MEKPHYKTKLRKYLRWAFWVLLVQFILFNISAALYAYKFTHIYDAPPAGGPPRKPNIITKTWRLFSGPMQTKSVISAVPLFRYDTVAFTTNDGTAIDSWYARHDSASKGTVLLFHGLLVNKSAVVAEASDFFAQGYNVLLTDFRAHGNSGGHTTTIGIRESEEVKLAFEYIKGQGEKTIILYGISMGAVAASKAIADYDLKPAAVILEMPFASLQSHIRARARAQGYQGGIIKPFSFLVTFWIGTERGLKAFKHQTVNYVSKINCPVLMQWGAMDNYVLVDETQKVYDAIGAKQKKLVVYPGAGHESLLLHDPEKWRREVEGFLSRAVPVNTGL